MSAVKIYLAPIQGITDFTFRNLFNKHFKGIFKFYTPFVRFGGKLEVKKSQQTDLLSEKNLVERLVPQILTNSADEILYFVGYVQKLGYSEVNWNLGCPFPMVTKRQLGSGLLPFPDKIDTILNGIFENNSLNFSVKMRLGYSRVEESIRILNVLNKYPVSEIIIHPRVGTQMYKGSVNPDAFLECSKISCHQVCYNGDINCYADYELVKSRYNRLDTLMIGRGLISNPFLAEQITLGNSLASDDKLERFSLFHAELFETYQDLLAGPGHLLQKMLQLWEYFSLAFENQHKVLKLIKKANSLTKYHNAIYEILNNQEFKL